ncbi:hypothetical protein HK098_002166 [Nowakowskiella sp. JEL0407]|nr:hypothetical protein HK098_002166 [Nowakowskiella sp. JEL0407]
MNQIENHNIHRHSRTPPPLRVNSFYSTISSNNSNSNQGSPVITPYHYHPNTLPPQYVQYQMPIYAPPPTSQTPQFPTPNQQYFVPHPMYHHPQLIFTNPLPPLPSPAIVTPITLPPPPKTPPPTVLPAKNHVHTVSSQTSLQELRIKTGSTSGREPEIIEVNQVQQRQRRSSEATQTSVKSTENNSSSLVRSHRRPRRKSQPDSEMVQKESAISPPPVPRIPSILRKQGKISQVKKNPESSSLGSIPRSVRKSMDVGNLKSKSQERNVGNSTRGSAQAGRKSLDVRQLSAKGNDSLSRHNVGNKSVDSVSTIFENPKKKSFDFPFPRKSLSRTQPKTPPSLAQVQNLQRKQTLIKKLSNQISNRFAKSFLRRRRANSLFSDEDDEEYQFQEEIYDVNEEVDLDEDEVLLGLYKPQLAEIQEYENLINAPSSSVSIGSTLHENDRIVDDDRRSVTSIQPSPKLAKAKLPVSVGVHAKEVFSTEISVDQDVSQVMVTLATVKKGALIKIIENSDGTSTVLCAEKDFIKMEEEQKVAEVVEKVSESQAEEKHAKEEEAVKEETIVYRIEPADVDEITSQDFGRDCLKILNFFMISS